MEIQTMEEMKLAFPEFVAQMETAAKEAGRAEGAKAERERLQAIEDIENAIADKAIVRNAKYGEKPLTAEQLALVAMQQEARIKAAVLDGMQNDGKATEGVKAAPNKGNEENTQKEDEAELVHGAVKVFQSMMGGKRNG